jgi:hypothetical protein
MRHALLLSVLLLGSAALAQETSPPPVMPTEAADPVLPTAFLDQALKVDSNNRISRGRSQETVSHRELFEQLGRTDLLARSQDLAAKRTWLIVGAVALSTAAIVTGSILIATAPNLATPACENDVDVYNNVCVPQAAQHNISGTAVIVSGVVGALLMAGFAYGSDPAVLTRDETVALVSTFNSRLARTLRRPPAGLRVLPLVTPDGAWLTASLRF